MTNHLNATKTRSNESISAIACQPISFLTSPVKRLQLITFAFLIAASMLLQLTKGGTKTVASIQTINLHAHTYSSQMHIVRYTSQSQRLNEYLFEGKEKLSILV